MALSLKSKSGKSASDSTNSVSPDLSTPEKRLQYCLDTRESNTIILHPVAFALYTVIYTVIIYYLPLGDFFRANKQKVNVIGW